jgi:YVTN family beta-propeller protein
VTAIKKATTGTGKFAVRVGTGTTAKCGVFVVQAVPAYVAATVNVGRSPSGVAIDATGVWVTNWWDNTLSKINPATNTVLSVVPVTLEGTEGPEAITTGGGSLWLTTSEFSETDTLAGSVLRIDPATGTVLANIPGGRGAYSIAYGLGAVWVANVMDGNVQRIDPATNAVTATIPITGAFGIAVDATAVWVAGVTGTVSRIDPATNLIVATIHTQATAANVAVGNGSIWVSHPGTVAAANGSVSRINPATNQVIANIPLGEQPFALAAAGGSIWVALYNLPTLIRINPATNTILSRTTLSSGVYAMAGTDRAVWTAHNLPIPEGGTEPPIGKVTRVGY